MAQAWTLRKPLMVTLAVAWFLSYADRVNMSVAAIPMQAEFGWDETTKGFVMGSVFIGYMSSQLLGGAMLFLALIPLANSALMALLATCAAMAALAFCYSGADPTVMEIAPRYRGFITGLVGTIATIPGVFAVPMIGWLVDTTGSYSWGFISAAILNMVGIAIWLVYGTGRKVID